MGVFALLGGTSGLLGAEATTWDMLEQMRADALKLSPGQESVAYLERFETTLRKFRTLGLERFRENPDDPQRWSWLVTALHPSPRYYRDAVAGARLQANRQDATYLVDREAEAAWQELIRGPVRREFFESSDVTSELRAQWLHYELNDLQRLLRDPQPARGDVVRFAMTLMNYAAEPAVRGGGENHTVEWGFSQLRYFAVQADLPRDEFARLIASLELSRNEQLIGYVQGLVRIWKLREEPLDLALKRFDGTTFNVTDLRGKVVLLDFWSTTCSSCIAAMPKLNALRLAHGASGFEIVGLCMDFEANRMKATQLASQWDWPSAWVQLEKPWQKTPEVGRFGITGFPLYLLIDTTGRLVGYDYYGEEGLRRLEADVKRQLSLVKN